MFSNKLGIGMMTTMRTSLSIAAAGFCFMLSLTSALATTIDISINEVSQKMTVRVDGSKEYVWPVSTGGPGYETPTGTYKPFRMEATHFSKEWDNSPMPHTMFFTQTGHAIHGSYHVKSLGRRASHGCVRLAPENAETLYEMVQKAGMQNTTITLTDGLFGGGFLSFNRPSSQTRDDQPGFFSHLKDRLLLRGGSRDEVRFIKVKRGDQPVDEKKQGKAGKSQKLAKAKTKPPAHKPVKKKPSVKAKSPNVAKADPV